MIPADTGPTITAMAHTLRKLGDFEDAAKLFDRALSLGPGQASTFAGLAYTYHLQVPLWLAASY